MNRSIHIITILGIPIEINYTWFIVFFLVTLTLAQNYFPRALPNAPTLLYWVIGAAAALLLFVTLLAHELSHSIVAIKNDLPIKGITLFVFGGVAHMTKEPQNPRTEFLMAAAGPLCSFSLSFIFYVLTQLMYNLRFPMALIVITDYISAINLILGIFNLIPGFPLDGGRILRAALWSIYGDIKKATRIASAFGKAFAYILMAAGFIYLFYGFLLSGIWLIFIGFFLREAAGSTYQQVVMRKLLTGLKVSDIMSKDVVTVLENLPIIIFVDDYVFRYRFTSFPVLSSHADIQGVVTIHAIKDIPRDQWSNKCVGEAMIPISKDLTVPPDTDAFSALQQMAGNGLGRLLVLRDGKQMGIISQRDILRLFEMKSDLGE
jgi:Zn-dependent protease/CBS domain-containing protein